MSRKKIFLGLTAVATCLLIALILVPMQSSTPASSAATPATGGAEKLTMEALTTGPSAVVVGNPEGDVTVIEYFDYQCPVCRTVHPDLQALLAEDSDVRMIHKHWPIFGSDSVDASRIALAARFQGKYEAVHDALMRASGRLGENEVREIAAAAGVDLHQLDRDLEAHAEEIESAMADASIQARLIGLGGTPSFLIGRYLVPGGIDLATMRQIVADVRAGKDKEG